MRDLVPFISNRSSITRPIFDEMDKLFNSAFGKDFFPTALQKSSYPKMNVYDKADKLHVDAYVPEVAKDDLTLSIEDGIMTISGSAGGSKEHEDENYYCREVSRRSFSRSIRLPDDVDTGNVKAKHDNGMLKIEIPRKIEEKKEKTQTVQID